LRQEWCRVLGTAAFPPRASVNRPLRCEFIDSHCGGICENSIFSPAPDLLGHGRPSGCSPGKPKPAKTRPDRKNKKVLFLTVAGGCRNGLFCGMGRGAGKLARSPGLLVGRLIANGDYRLVLVEERHKTPELSVKAEVYRRALEKLLWCVAVGMFAMLSAATRQEYWQTHNVARAIGYGILVAGSAFICGVLAGYLF